MGDDFGGTTAVSSKKKWSARRGDRLTYKSGRRRSSAFAQR
jgi:hypothetical protein